jgi:hypothetical protein
MLGMLHHVQHLLGLCVRLQGDLALACCAALQLTPPSDAHGNGVVALQHVLDALAAKHKLMSQSRPQDVVVPSSQDSDSAAVQIGGSGCDNGVVTGCGGNVMRPTAGMGGGGPVGSARGVSACHVAHNMHNSAVDGSIASPAAAHGGVGQGGSGGVANGADVLELGQQLVGVVQPGAVVQQPIIPVVSVGVPSCAAAGGAAAASGPDVQVKGREGGHLQGMAVSPSSVVGSLEAGKLAGAEWVRTISRLCTE